MSRWLFVVVAIVAIGIAIWQMSALRRANAELSALGQQIAEQKTALLAQRGQISHLSEDNRRVHSEIGEALKMSRRKNFGVVRVLYATDRNRVDARDEDEEFGNDRGDLSFGFCDVSIPLAHKTGRLEAPSWLRLEFREDPAKHVVVLRTAVTSAQSFYQQLSARVRASKRSDTFLFVHGYNVSFAGAARRTAQMAHDLGFKGAPVFYSWPSHGSTAAYTIDEQNIEWAQANLRKFLETFITESRAENIYLIAHSMGNRALTRAAISLFNERPELAKRLTEVILTAPDIDTGVFVRDIAPPLLAAKRPITLYASARDRALLASKTVHGYPRAGDSGSGLVVIPGIETVDATLADTSLLGHSYYGDARSVLSDIYHIFRGHRAGDRFGLRAAQAEGGAYWEFAP